MLVVDERVGKKKNYTAAVRAGAHHEQPFWAVQSFYEILDKLNNNM